MSARFRVQQPAKDTFRICAGSDTSQKSLARLAEINPVMDKTILISSLEATSHNMSVTSCARSKYFRHHVRSTRNNLECDRLITTRLMCRNSSFCDNGSPQEILSRSLTLLVNTCYNFDLGINFRLSPLP